MSLQQENFEEEDEEDDDEVDRPEGFERRSWKGKSYDKEAGLDRLIVYKGEWKAGLPEGEGVCMFENGEIYTGGFVAGKFDGEGSYCWSDGAELHGTFRRGQLVGIDHVDGVEPVVEFPDDDDFTCGGELFFCSTVTPSPRKVLLDRHFKTLPIVTGDSDVIVDDDVESSFPTVSPLSWDQLSDDDSSF